MYIPPWSILGILEFISFESKYFRHFPKCTATIDQEVIFFPRKFRNQNV